MSGKSVRGECRAGEAYRTILERILMKYTLFLIACFTTFLFTPFVSGMEQQQEDPTQKYRATKAHEAVIYDKFKEAQPYTQELPEHFKKTIADFGFKEDEIKFYTAVRMNRFVKKAGNNIVILRPNFFLYLTPEEQSVEIACRLAQIKAGDNYEVGGKNNPEKALLADLKKYSIGATALGLALLYRKDLSAQAQLYWPTIQKILLSKGAALVAGCLTLNGLAKMLYKQNKNRNYLQYEKDVIDHCGPQGLLAVREKQVGWGKRNASWLAYQWGMLKGKLFLTMMPEVELERLQEHIQSK